MSNDSVCIITSKETIVDETDLRWMWSREPNVRFSKIFNPKEKRDQNLEYRRGIKDPNTTRLRCGPVSHTTMLVKVFQYLDSTLAKELERGLPTGSRLWYQLVMPLLDRALIIHANAHDRDQRLTGRYHNTTLNTNKRHTSFILQARGLEGSNT